MSGEVRWDETAGAFLISGYEEASAVLRGTGWSSDPRRSPRTPPQFADLPPNVLLFLDPPDHTRLRRMLSPAFTPRAIERLRPRVTAIVDAALDGLEDGADIVADLAYLVPLAVVAELLDVGVAGAELFRDETPALAGLLELDVTEDGVARAAAASTEIMLFLTPLIAERTTRPGDDFVSALLAVDGIEPEEVLATCVLLLAAGHETTANLIGTGTLAVLDDPGRRAALLDDPPRAVEELLRHQSPVKLAGRVALSDQTVGGAAIPAGSQVFVMIGEANRDPRHVPDASRLDLTRAPLPHLAFGAGAHFCLGAALARMEAAETLSRLFARFPNLTRDGAATWRASSTFHGLDELRVRL
ncbi:6-deoxyerythronolide B hydroxylase [Actinomadura rubteroloni]|uniref:6-deoxyerythronolide B hydroxylase n=1 Tax=Actinomadura rubteroloni TaxID=1926885 RepID=A0A2P4UMN8_9ACTN|nr:cytochrome P450 [Actinomadura rubteroloni]POM26308.1 6-deoxyerythronolide B hydroxylase [Actinomadura rubteroloni]